MTPETEDPQATELGVVDLRTLAREIAARMVPDALLDAQDVAALLNISPHTVQNRAAAIPGFPKAIRLVLTKGARGVSRWERREILEWVQKQKEGRRGGARRKPVN